MSTILLADDSLTIQKVVELTFADTEHSVVAVSGGDELLQKLPQVRPDLIICDVIMPGRDGYDVCQQIKSEPSTLHIPVVLLTGTFEPFDRDRALAAGCSEIVTKPFEARKLVETVEKLLPSAPVDQLRADTGPIDQPSRFEGELTPPAPGAATEGNQLGGDFGTQLASQPEEAAPPEGDEEALEFTSTGFDEMEAAGRAQAEQDYEEPAEALDFDQDAVAAEDLPADESTPLGEEPGEGETSMEPEPESPVANWQTGAVPGSSPPTVEPIAATEETPPPVAPLAASPEPEPVEAETTAPPAEEAEPFAEERQVPPAPAEAETVTEPFAEPEEEMVAAPGNESESTEPPVSTPPPAEGDEMALMATQPGVALPTTTMPMPTMEEPPEPPAPDGEAAEPPAPIPKAEVLAPLPQPAAASTLSDEDVDRIARRVLELARDTFERIAWDVVPDMAELVVRERVRELEAEAEGQAQEPN